MRHWEWIKGIIIIIFIIIINIIIIIIIIINIIIIVIITRFFSCKNIWKILSGGIEKFSSPTEKLVFLL